MDRIDVILPVYNAEAVLGEALASLRAQTDSNWRALILDDGSDDGSLTVARHWARKEPRFSVIALPHRGLVPTLNAGLEQSDAPLIARMDADDICAPERLAAERQLLEACDEATVVSCAISSFHSDGSPPGSGMQRYVEWVNRVLSPADHHRERFVESSVAHSAVLAPRALFQRRYQDLDWCEDYDLWLHLMQRGVPFAKVPDVLLQVRDQPHRLSRNDQRYSQDALRRCKIAHLLHDRGPLAGRSQVLFWGAGRVGKRWLRELPPLGVSIPAVVELHPGKLGKDIHGAMAIPPEALAEAWQALAAPFLLVGVGARGARREIREWLTAEGYRELEDYLVVA